MIVIINKKMKERLTKQKELLQEEINKINSFFTAEELLNKVNKKNKKIGIATIYRFLKNLTKKGKLHSYLCDRKTIYSIHKKSHCHFICEKCGKTEHIEIKNIDFIKNKIKNTICHFQIDISGICEKCKKD